MNPTPARLLCALFSLGLTTGAMARISTDSPFVPRNGQAMAAPTENSPIELRGVMASPDGLRFGIYEPASQRGSWVKVNEPGQGYVVKAFDAGRSSVSIEYQGRVQTLTLKEAKFDGTIAAAPLIATGGPQVRPAVAPGAPATASNPAEEAKRLEQVASEVRRRRAARQAATTPAPGGQPAPATTTATTP
ncbi:MAG: hypothetical protein QM760_05815 [Nibricoccus sp.]